jgi:hypothetical protein
MPPSSPRATARRRRRASAPRGPTGPVGGRLLRPTSLRDATEDLGDVLEESVRHLLLSEAPPGWSAGPVRAVPFAEITPGTLGWEVAIGRSGSDRPNAPVGDVFLFILPRTGPDVDRPADPPLVGRRWDEFSSSTYHPGPPRLLLLTRAAAGGPADALGAWGATLLREVAGELE